MSKTPQDKLNGPVGNGKGNPATGDHQSPHGTQGLIQLCVIVEKDGLGYGLTVSGDKPVHVQSVKENGASARAGVRTGDRIYKVNGASVAQFDHTEVVSLIKAGSHVALTLLRKPDQKSPKTPTSPSSISVGSGKSSGGGSDRITHPLPVDNEKEQNMAKEKIDTFKRMLEEAASNEKKLQSEYSKNKNSKTEAKLNDAKKTTGAIRKQLDSLTSSSHSSSLSDVKNPQNRNSVCLGEFAALSAAESSLSTTVGGSQRPLKASWSISGAFGSAKNDSSPSRKISRARNMSVKRSNSDSVRKSSLFSHQLPAALKRKLMMRKTVSLPTSVDTTDSSHIVRSPIHSTIGEYIPGTTSPISDDTDEEGSMRRMSSTSYGRTSQNPASEIFSMDDDDFSPESQTVVKDHGPFIDFELLRNRHAHCSVFLSFLISNADPAPMLFTLVSELYMNGSIRDMKKWAYEIHSTFIVKDAPLPIKVDDIIIDGIESILNSNAEREDLWRKVFDRARLAASDDISASLADFRQKRELGLGNFFGDGELSDNIDRLTEQRIVEKTLRPHYDKFANDETSARSVAMCLSLTTVMKEWGIHKSSMERQVSFAMKDISKSSFKAGLVNKFKQSKKETRNHHFTQSSYQSTTFCDHCSNLIWGIGFQGYNCSSCDMNIHKECMSSVEMCRKDKKKKKRESLKPNKMKPSNSMTNTSSTSMLSEDATKEPSPSSATDEDAPAHSVASLKERFEGSQPNTSTTNGEVTKGSNVGRSESFNRKPEKQKDVKRNKSDVDKDNGDVLKAIDQSRSGSSSSSLSAKSDSSSTEKVNDISKPPPIDEDSDLEVEESMPPLDSVIRKELLRKMKPKEKKLQEVINELFYTERSHVRNLKLLDKLFHIPMSKVDFCSKELVELIFPAIQAIIEVHAQLNDEMKAKMKDDPLVNVKDVANILLRRFDSEAGEKMKECCALFCRNHAYALGVLKEKRKQNTKLHDLLSAGETNPMCRRLQFKDLMIGEVHRLTKYPLLIDSMSNYTTTSSEEHMLLLKASKCSRDILTHVNIAVKDCENHHKLVNLQKRLDTKQIQNSQNPLVANYKNLNLQDYKLIYEGALTWRLSTNKAKQIDLHVVLLEDVLVLLQVQDDGKLVLKCQSQIATQSTMKDDGKFGHSPIITLDSMLVRQVAADKKAIYIINTSQLGPQIYDLVANSVEEKKRWFKYISEAADSQKKSNTIPRPRTSAVNKSNLTLTEVTNDESTTEPADADSMDEANITTNNNVTVESCNNWVDSPPPYSQLSGAEEDDQSNRAKSATELLNEKDEIIRKALSDKQRLLESLASNSQEVSTELDGERDAKSLVLASISDAMLLTKFLSSATTTTATTQAVPQLALPAANTSPVKSSELVTSASTASAAELQSISVLNSLSKRLNNLLGVMEEQENENARLRHQLQTAEQLLRDAPKDMGDSRPNSFVSNSSSSAASAGETSTDSQINAMSSSLPVISSSAPVLAPPTSSALDDEDDVNSSSNTDTDDSDDETVYADTKDDLPTEGQDELKHRPDSVMSDLSNTHTDNTLLSTENLADESGGTELRNKNSSNSNVTDSDSEQPLTEAEGGNSPASMHTRVIPQVEVKVHSASSSSIDSDCEDNDENIEQSNIDDIVTSPASPDSVRVGDVVYNGDMNTDEQPASEVEIRTACKVVDDAMKAALDIMRAESSSDADDIEDVDTESHPIVTVDCDTIDIDVIESDTEYHSASGDHSASGGAGVDNIDDSDEADALSASSLD